MREAELDPYPSSTRPTRRSTSRISRPSPDPARTPVPVREPAAIAALQAYLSPATWAAPATGETIGWQDKPTVYLYEVAAVLDAVAGLDVVTDPRLGLKAERSARPAST